MGQREPLVPRQIGGMGQKDMARGAFPLRIRGREMLADVAHRQSPINRVRHRVHAHIRVRMAHKPLVMAIFTPHSIT